MNVAAELIELDVSFDEDPDRLTRLLSLIGFETIFAPNQEATECNEPPLATRARKSGTPKTKRA